MKSNTVQRKSSPWPSIIARSLDNSGLWI